jgi:hypothetical protein
MIYAGFTNCPSEAANARNALLIEENQMLSREWKLLNRAIPLHPSEIRLFSISKWRSEKETAVAILNLSLQIQ